MEILMTAVAPGVASADSIKVISELLDAMT